MHEDTECPRLRAGLAPAQVLQPAHRILQGSADLLPSVLVRPVLGQGNLELLGHLALGEPESAAESLQLHRPQATAMLPRQTASATTLAQHGGLRASRGD